MQSPENFARKSGRREEKQLVNQLLLPPLLPAIFKLVALPIVLKLTR